MTELEPNSSSGRLHRPQSESRLARASRRPAFICLLLVAVTIAVYGRVVGFEFINYDDSDYIVENAPVQAGLTWRGTVWALGTRHAGNWHPLTWVSHMLDVEVFGTGAAGPHAVNLVFHTANAVLLFLLLNRLTGSAWRSAFVAGLFSLHPLHVESVAWVSERKDVLSAFFFMLTLLAYAKHVEQSKVQSPKPKVWYGLALVCFTLGLMSKPMLVTLPFVLLLLDYWPLRRFGVQSPKSKVQSSNAPSSNTQHATRIRHHSTTPPLHHSLCFWRSSRSSPSRSPRAW
jgi:protein O-mannosyl-transferase